MAGRAVVDRLPADRGPVPGTADQEPATRSGDPNGGDAFYDGLVRRAPQQVLAVLRTFDPAATSTAEEVRNFMAARLSDKHRENLKRYADAMVGRNKKAMSVDEVAALIRTPSSQDSGVLGRVLPLLAADLFTMSFTVHQVDGQPLTIGPARGAAVAAGTDTAIDVMRPARPAGHFVVMTDGEYPRPDVFARRSGAYPASAWVPVPAGLLDERGSEPAAGHRPTTRSEPETATTASAGTSTPGDLVVTPQAAGESRSSGRIRSSSTSPCPLLPPRAGRPTAASSTPRRTPSTRSRATRTRSRPRRCRGRPGSWPKARSATALTREELRDGVVVPAGRFFPSGDHVRRTDLSAAAALPTIPGWFVGYVHRDPQVDLVFFGNLMMTHRSSRSWCGGSTSTGCRCG